ncbi:glucose-6-phosphate isomerase [Brumimicrobium mesophilum]|uniref:glucose-6-phosphate isomerase n=1 Tax=Brumimicrobium mesophilum TaxID=392717 RepID=UPI000D13FD41|nr:glucose-6-phosphate isomerase [Brumimicrobium mesophilum]
MLPKINPSKTLAWQKLKDHFLKNKNVHLNDLFQADDSRFEKLSFEIEDFLFDFSKNIANEETFKLLIELAKECKLEDAIDALFHGKHINETEERAVLHTALRSFSNESFIVDGKEINCIVKNEREKLKSFCELVHTKKWKGYSGKNINYIVNIGIGGSDLGSSMVTEALRPYQIESIKPYFISNVDGSNLSEVLKKIELEETLFIVASKTFTTQETMTNAYSIRELFLESCKDEALLKNHFIAVTGNKEKAMEFGIQEENIFKIWDWVCGRFSLWGSMGLPIALTIGYQNYEELLKGANSIDLHFKSEKFEKNIPVIMGLLSIWYINFYNAQSEAILAYDHYLSKFKSYLQQGSMESNGKSIDRNGDPVSYQTGVVVWGETGTNGQHSFHQLLHQGTPLIPCDFIVSVQSQNHFNDHQDEVLSNALAQTEALMKGRTKAEVLEKNLNSDKIDINYKVFSGNKPSNSILIKKLTPYNLGSLLAVYEHKIFVKGIIWNIFSFDQWGVELGKELSSHKLSSIRSKSQSTHSDSSTNGLIGKILEWRS